MVLHDWWVGMHITMCLKLLGVWKVGSTDLRAEQTKWQVAATNCFGVPENFCENLSWQQNFFFSSSSTKLNQTEFVWLVVVKKILQHTLSNLLLQLIAQPVHTEWFVAAMCYSDMSPSVFRPLSYTLAVMNPRSGN